MELDVLEGQRGTALRLDAARRSAHLGKGLKTPGYKRWIFWKSQARA
jgi:hypothetical protein